MDKLRMRQLATLVLAIATTALPGVALDLESLTFVEVFRGISNTTSITHARDGTGRLFVTEQTGRILIFDGQDLLDRPFLDIRDRVRAGGERGLLSVAFHPQYTTNGYFFVYYTDLTSDTVVSRFQVTEDAGLANPDSETVFLEVDQPRNNHNGGQMHFGPDGYLYVALGDGGGARDPLDAGQDLNSLLGKMLRLDVENGISNLVPESNPFVGMEGVRPEIWSYGLRNPWRFSFDRLTGDMFIADVGQNAVEEVSFQPASSTGGENYGWRLMEGSACFNPSFNCNDGSLVLPIAEYANLGGNCGGSITGGYRYRGARFPQLNGVYFFADYCTGDFYGAVEEGGSWMKIGPRETPLNIRTFGEDELGEVYLADASVVYRIEAPQPAPQISLGGVVNAASLQVGTGLAPGSLASVFGTALAANTEIYTGYPLPGMLGGGSMLFNNSIPVPQVFASAGQRNIQIPWELAGLPNAKLTVTVEDRVSAERSVPLAIASPGVFTLNAYGQAAAMIGPEGAIVAAPASFLLGARPVRHGETLQVFTTGLGPVTNQPATGAAAPVDPPSVTTIPVEVRIGGQPMKVLFSGLAPPYAGIYRVDVEVNDTAPAGSVVPLVVRAAGSDSNTTYVAIEAPEPQHPVGE